MPDGKVFVNFSYDYTKSQIICIVNDTGIGIKPEKQQSIFNLFDLMDSSYPKGSTKSDPNY